MKLRALIAAGILAVLSTDIAAAQTLTGQPRLLSITGKWGAYIIFEDGGKTCYVAGKVGPDAALTDRERKKLQLQNAAPKRAAYVLITQRPWADEDDVFTFIAGYTFKKGSAAKAEIDGVKYDLFTDGGMAWAADEQTDQKIARAMRDGKSMTLIGTDSKGKAIKDDVDLKGLTAAYNRTQSEC